jgi:hypothetical protein
VILFFSVLSTRFLDLHEFDIFFVELDFLVPLKLSLLEFLHNSLNLMVLHGHKSELFFVELNFREELIALLFLKFLILINVLVLAFQSIVFLNQFFVTFLELLIFIVNVLD